MAAEQFDALIPVIVGGVIGLLGGLVGPPLAHWLSERSEKKKKKAEKLEELIGALYAHEHWLDLLKNIRAFGFEDTHPASPLPNARAISAIYFPHLQNSLTELERVAREYEGWMLIAAGKRLEGKIDGLNEGIHDAYRPYIGALTNLLEEIRQYADREFAQFRVSSAAPPAPPPFSGMNSTPHDVLFEMKRRQNSSADLGQS